MNLDTEDRTVIAGASEEDVSAAIARLTSTRQARFAVLQSAKQFYIQCYVNADESLDVQYRDGGPDRHYETALPQSKPAVTDAFLSFLAGDNRWRTAFEWRRLPEGQL